jgi:hypothetical protein
MGGHDGGMSGRWLMWCGGVVAVAAAVGLGVYVAVAGLDEADKLASVLGALAGLAGLIVAIYGVMLDRQGGGGQPAGGASGDRSISAGGDISGIASTGDGATNTQNR